LLSTNAPTVPLQNKYVIVYYPFRNILTSASGLITELLVGVDESEVRLSADSEFPMYSRMQFAALELMCRERAALAKKEMEYSLAEYWLAEAEEWKEFCDLSYPFIDNASPIAPVT
jgi:hypothetical protein